jgi:hypothetical protein
MKRGRKWITVITLAGCGLVPLPGCQGAPQCLGAVMQLALGVGASVGSYFLIKELD